MDIYYKRPQDVQMFNRNDWIKWKTSTPRRELTDGNVLRVRPPERRNIQQTTTWLLMSN